jgi:hypothetical protein
MRQRLQNVDRKYPHIGVIVNQQNVDIRLNLIGKAFKRLVAG